mgnify:CR=1 FL=1
MQVLALSRRLEGTTPERLAAHAADEARGAWELHTEARVAWQLHAEVLLRSVHLCPERPGSVIVLECASLEEAREALQRLPMVQAGLITFDLSRMLPYTGWAALFGAGTSA